MMTQCPECGRAVDAHQVVARDGGPPVAVYPDDGDVSVCLYCAAVGVFRSGPFGVTIERPTEEESAKILDDPDLRTVVEMISRLHRP